MSRYAVVTAVADYHEHVRAAATGVLAGEVHSWNGEAFPGEPVELLNQLPDQQLLDVVVLGPGVPLDAALRLAGDFEIQRPEVSVLLVAVPTPELVLSAMRAGIRDVVEPDADVNSVSALLHRATRSASIRRRAAGIPADDAAGNTRGRVIAVMSPKGGAGKTTVASNLAIGLAGAAPHATVLLDLDLQFGDVASALSISPEHSVSDAVHGPAGRDTMVLKSFLSAHPSGLYALCAPESPGMADQVTGEQVAHLVDQLAGLYRFIVIDTSPGLSEHTLAALDQATDLVLVSSMDVPGVRGMRKELNVLRELGMGATPRHLVLNAADPRDGLSQRDVEATLGVGVDVVVPASRAVRLSTNQGVPLLSRNGRDPASKALRKLVGRFAPTPSPARKRGARHRIGTP
ncbi:MAG: MinD/ParA family protein [Arthrobacter sp.]|nr:MinD/ParA family protein [Arthrobacter sp.]